MATGGTSGSAISGARAIAIKVENLDRFVASGTTAVMAKNYANAVREIRRSGRVSLGEPIAAGPVSVSSAASAPTAAPLAAPTGSVLSTTGPIRSIQGVGDAGRRRAVRAFAEQQRIDAGEIPDPTRRFSVSFEVRVVDAFNPVELADRIGRGDLFTRRGGQRPFQVTRRTTGVLDEQEQFNALFHEPKPETQGVLRIVRTNPQTRRASDAPVAPEPFEVLCETAEFLLQNGQEVDSEKFQIVNTFDLPRVHLLGRRARIWTYSGILANSFNLQWKNRFLDMYDRYLRGTRAVRIGAVAQLIYDDVLREGYILSNSISPTQSMLNAVPFTFSMFVTRAVILADSATVRCPEAEVLIDNVDTVTDVERPRINTLVNVPTDVQARIVSKVRDEVFATDGSISTLAGLGVGVA